MPTNNVSDLITDQEMAIARLVLSGTMNDRDADQAAGLNPDTASYTKSKPVSATTCSSTVPPRSNSSPTTSFWPASGKSPTKSTPPPDQATMHAAAWHAEQKQKAIHPDPSPAVALEEADPSQSIAAGHRKRPKRLNFLEFYKIE
jgi:hypothetical protein